MKPCKVCGKEAYKDLDYCKSCAEALCIMAESITMDQDARKTITLIEEEVVYRLKLLVEKGWQHDI